ncbi:MAG: hypothetical protein A2Z18_04980 [Armatimonadetes bacterium RBG_16_58_9]|nr:MAG: hypothetical protein A2Z18_04980 [Armatimonadetes bacterium RBG_16_58_9]
MRAASGPFIWDDNFLLDQLRDRGPSSPLSLFTSGFLIRPEGGADFYRPIVLLSLLLDKSVWGSHPVGYHATNLALHAISIIAVAWFAWQLLKSRAGAIAAAFLFAVHPAHAESVCWISGRTDLLCAAFTLGSLNLFLWSRAKSSRLALAGSYLLAGLALLSKELAVVIPVLVVLSWWAAGERSFRRMALAALPFVVIAGVYTAARANVLQGAEMVSEPLLPLYRASTIAYSLFTHFQILLLPYKAHLSYEVVMQEIANANTFMVLLSMVVLTVFLWSSRRSAPVPLFGMLWFLTTILPVSLLAGQQISTIVSQRFLYLPSVGLAVVFGWAIALVARLRVPAKALGIAAAAAVVVALSVLSVSWSGLWANEVAFWEQFTRDTPTIGSSYYHLGLAYCRAGDYDKAIRAHEAARDLMPDQPEPEYGLGQAYSAKSDFRDAAKHYSYALDLAPGNPMLQEKLDEAMRRGGRVTPD